jgi:replicative DNA helicase
MAQVEMMHTPNPDDVTEDITVRTLPHNLEAEQSLLGALLMDNRINEEFSDYLRPNHFFVPVHQRIYDAVLKIADRGQNADAVTVKAYFEKDDELKDVGGAGYISDLASSVVSIFNSKHYAQIIFDLFIRRELIAIGRDVVNDAYEQDIDSDSSTALEEAEKKLYTLAESDGGNSGGFITMKDAVNISIAMAEKAFQTDGNVTGVTTGLRDMDKKLGGLQPSDLLILAARPAMGKTSLAVNIAYNAANAYAKSGGSEGGRTGVISLEMSADQLATRLLSSLSGIPSEKMRTGGFNAEDFYRIKDVAGWLSQIPLYIDDTPAQTITAVRTRARRMKRKHGLDMLIVDYLQLLRGTGSKQSENRVLEVSEITRGLKAIAKELEIPVIALSQLSRGVESREDKRPQLSDLRESGSIEQDADVVMFIYRDEYYLQNAEPDTSDSTKHAEWTDKMEKARSIAQIIIAKQRHGSTGTIDLRFDGQFTRFEDLDKYHNERL